MKLLDILHNRLKEEILVLDGAMGTMIQRYNLSENDFKGEKFQDHKNDLKGNNDILNLTQPEIIREIHSKYLGAGADIIETNTFNANAISQRDYNLEDFCYDINYQAASLAKKAVDEHRSKNKKVCFIAGSIGPTNQTLSMSPDVNDPSYRAISYEELYNAYYDQISGLAEGGADIILIETIFDTLNAKTAIKAVSDYFDKSEVKLPVMLSGTIVDQSGRTLSGQKIDAFLVSVMHTPNLLSIGLNCSLGSAQMRPFIEELSDLADVYTSLYPNAGLPDELGNYNETPDFMAEVAKDYSESGYVNIIGGCCGTTPEHIKILKDTVSSIKPRKIRHEIYSQS